MLHSTHLKCAAAILGLAGGAAAAIATPPSGVSPTNFVTETMEEPIRAKNDKIDLKTKDATIIRSQLLTFGENSTTGWHHHPGLVIVGVESGTIELWNEDCSKTAYGPGQDAGTVFVEALPHAHQATSAGGALVRVTYIVPSTGPITAANFRVEENAPFCATSF